MTWPSCKVLMVIQKGSYKTAKVCISLINAVLPNSFMIGILCQHVLWCWKVLDELICTGLGILAGTWIKSLLSPCLHVYVYLGNMKEIGIKVIRQWWTIFARVGDLVTHFLKLKFQMLYLSCSSFFLSGHGGSIYRTREIDFQCTPTSELDTVSLQFRGRRKNIWKSNNMKIWKNAIYKYLWSASLCVQVILYPGAL